MRARVAISSAVSRPNRLTKELAILPGKRLSKKPIADPPAMAYPGAEYCSPLSLIPLWTSPTPITKEGTKAPSTPPIVAAIGTVIGPPNAPTAAPALAPRNPPAILGAIIGICDPAVSFAHCPKSPAPPTSASRDGCGYCLASSMLRSRPAFPKAVSPSAPTSSPATSAALYPSSCATSTPRAKDCMKVASPSGGTVS